MIPVVGSVMAIWLGVGAKREIREDPTVGGEGLATAGVILGIVGLVMVAVAIVGLFALELGMSRLQGA